MTTWLELYKAHRGTLRRRLVELAERGHCERTIQGRFTRRERGALRELHIQRDDVQTQGEPLSALPALQDARLTVLALLSRKADHVHQFTAMIKRTTCGGQPWVAAVHLEDDRATVEQDRKGGGACSHAALHCHIGPTLDDEPKVRVPLPAIELGDAFDWLLSTVVPGWEPARWSQIWPAAQE
ncbi:MAG TPA: hypothetical protein VFK02_00625 [Kofleriaceae bacterium]|nr:hypothetical protein [Kofleriaceae bacterium]